MLHLSKNVMGHIITSITKFSQCNLFKNTNNCNNITLLQINNILIKCC